MAEVRPLDDLDNATASLDEIINLADQELKAQSGRRTSHQYTLKNVPAEQKLIPPPSQLQQPSGTTHIDLHGWTSGISLIILLIYLFDCFRFPAPSVPPPLEMPPPPPQPRPSLIARQNELNELLQANDAEEYKLLLQLANKNLKIKSQQHEETVKDLLEAKKRITAAEQENAQLMVCNLFCLLSHDVT